MQYDKYVKLMRFSLINIDSKLKVLLNKQLVSKIIRGKPLNVV